MRPAELWKRAAGLARRQTSNFKLLLLRRALHGLASGLTVQYNSLYATLLGANPVQLGSLQSLGNAIGAFAGLPAGWFIDYYGLKGVFLVGTLLLGAARLVYLVAPQWTWLYVGMVLYYLGVRVLCTSCTVACAAELPNEERATTGRGLCRTLSSVVAIAAPLLAAWIISLLGGIGVRGIRPLYAIQVALFAAMFVLLLTRLSGSHATGRATNAREVVSGFVNVFRQSPDVLRLLLVMGLMELPWSITQPFMPVYAHEVKGADEFVLSGMSMASTIVPMLISIPLGWLADRYGRKRLLFIIAPMAYVANLCLILAPTGSAWASWVLMLYGVFFGFNTISMALAASMTAEIMPQGQMGRWIGMVSLFRGLLSIPAPLIGGLIWEHVGPQYVFLAAIALDAFLRLPLLASVRETLHLETSG
jgi:MFS family permease